jgi:CheY-like chemotaxis protein
MTLSPVLYVEDDKNDVIFMNQTWGDAQIQNQLLTVCDGQAAMDYLEGRAAYADRKLFPLPGLILMDLNLPRKTGLEVLKWIRAHPVYNTLPVIVFTSSNREMDIYKSYALGANAFIVKPAMMDDLLAAVKVLKEFWLRVNQPPPEVPPPGANQVKPTSSGE